MIIFVAIAVLGVIGTAIALLVNNVNVSGQPLTDEQKQKRHERNKTIGMVGVAVVGSSVLAAKSAARDENLRSLRTPPQPQWDPGAAARQQRLSAPVYYPTQPVFPLAATNPALFNALAHIPNGLDGIY